MSILSCDVYGCPNIMCSRISHKLNKYICNDCFDRIVKIGILNKTQILEFFKTEPPELIDDLVDVETYYESIFSVN